MYVENYMTRNPIVIQEDVSVLEAMRTLRTKKIRKLPVMSGEKLVGIVTSKDLKEGSPSDATSLEVHELNYLLSTRPVKEIMTPKPITIGPRDLIEKAAMLMHDNKFESLPVLDDQGMLVGIITESDLFTYLVDLSGIKDGGVVFDLELADQSGSVQDAADVMRQHGAKIRSILVSYKGVREGFRRVMIRTTSGDVDVISKEIGSKFKLVSVAR